MESVKNQIKEFVNKLENPNYEICGVVLQDKKGKYIVRMIENLGGALWYKMNPVALGKATEDSDLFVTGAPLKFIAFWHTHPVILHNPSTMDLDNMIVGRTYFIYCIPEDRLTIWEKKGDY